MASRVGNYLLFETLGEGAFGKVKLGVHEETGEQVAVKIMDKSDIKAQEMTMNVRREIAIMKALKHRNIVNLRQVLTSQSKLYIVMDLVTGGELFTKILREGRLPENVARRYFQQLVDGIEYCHRRGVCHRDLKPENLLIDETTGELKITDFGLSAMKGASTTDELLHTQCGSPNYCAPEIIARHKQGYNGSMVDAWSCGIILFALLAGYLPFYDENTKVLYRMIQRDEVRFPKKFPPDAKDLVLKLLHKEPEKRFTLQEVKKHRWFTIDYDGVDSGPASHSGTSPHKGGRKTHRRGRSMDTGPRSRDIQPRKKSDKSEKSDAESSQAQPPLPPAPPATVPAPPEVVDSRHPPTANRPPAPPAVTPPPISPVSQHTSVPSPASGQVAAPILPAVIPPVAPSYSAPTYPADDTSRPKSQESRPQVPPSNVSSGVEPPPYRHPELQGASGDILQILDPASGSLQHPVSVAPPASIPLSRDIVDHVESPMPTPSPPGTMASGPGAENGPPYPGATVRFENVDGDHEASSPTKPPKSKWTITSPPPPPSYRASMQAPVTTPQALAEGDTSWMKRGNRGYDSGRFVQTGNSEPKSSDPTGESDSKPLSLVERRRLQFAQEAARPPPLPENSTTRPTHKRYPSIEDTSEPRSGSGGRFGDRGEMKMRTAYPMASGGQKLSEVSTNVAAMSAVSGPLPDVSGTSSPSLEERVDGNMAFKPDVVHSGDIDSGSSGEAVEPSKVDGESSQDPVTSLSVPEISIEDGAFVPMLKDRLTAAVARYRRIFRLGANIGITASPSFSSNRGISSAADEASEAKLASEKSDFFLRAKGVTGAWGIILSQELEDDSDSEDDRPKVTEQELDAFSRLLDFWDRRRESASSPNGTEAVLDDEQSSPLVEEDILKIQSLLQKLEPKPVEEEVRDVNAGVEPQPSSVTEQFTEVEEDAETVVTVPGNEEDSLADIRVDGAEPRADADSDTEEVHPVLTTTDSGNPMEGDTNVDDPDAEDFAVPVVTQAAMGGPPAPPPMPKFNFTGNKSRLLAPPPPPPPRASQTAPWDRPANRTVEAPPALPPPTPPAAVPPAPPPPPPVHRPAHNLGKIDVAVPPPPPPPPLPSSGEVSTAPEYAAPQRNGGTTVKFDLSPSTVRDPIRGSGEVASVYRRAGSRGEEGGSKSSHGQKVRIDPSVDVIKNGRHSDAYSSVKESDNGPKRKSAANADVKKVNAREPVRNHSEASGASDGSGGGRRKGHIRSPSRDDSATRGMFNLNLFGRRKLSALNTLESELHPEKCLHIIGKILVEMECKVMMKKGEYKMKSEVELKQELLRISITCTQERGMSLVQFKKGKRDRSQLDAKEFYDFFRVVEARFHDRVNAEGHNLEG